MSVASTTSTLATPRRLALLSFPGTGHFNPLAALGKALVARGHTVHFVAVLDLEAQVAAAGLQYLPIGRHCHPVGTLRRLDEQTGVLKGRAALRQVIGRAIDICRMELDELPAILREARINMLLADSTSFTALTVAQHIGIACMTVELLAPLFDECSSPPYIFAWRYADWFLPRLRNYLGNQLYFYLLSPIRAEVNRRRVEWGMAASRRIDDFWSPRARVSHMPRALDFPRRRWPANFHHTGPFIDRTHRPRPAFPYERLDGRPLVYASMGTLSNSIVRVFGVIARAFATLEVQLVLSTGGGLSEAALWDEMRRQGATDDGRDSVLVVRYAPQVDLIERSVLVVCHGGVNTCLEAVVCGKPMLIIPVFGDQPGNARRLERVGVAEAVFLDELTVEKLRKAAGRVLTDKQYAARAEALRKTVKESRGMERAVELVEGELRTC